MDNLIADNPDGPTRAEMVQKAIEDRYWDAMARQVLERERNEMRLFEGFQVRCVPVEILPFPQDF